MQTHGLPGLPPGDGGPPPLDEGLIALRVDLRDRRITAATAALDAFFGCPPAALVGRSLADLWAEPERRAIAERFDEAVLLGRDCFGALCLLRDDGTPVWVDVDARFMYRGGQRLEIALTPCERPVAPAPPRTSPVTRSPLAVGAPLEPSRVDVAAPPPPVAPAPAPPWAVRDRAVVDARASQVPVVPAGQVAGVLEAAEVAALAIAPDGRVTAVTPAAARTLGLTPSDGIGRQLEQVVDLTATAADALSVARAGGLRQSVRASLGRPPQALVLEWVPGDTPGEGYAVLGAPEVPLGAETERLRFMSTMVSHVSHDLRDTLAAIYCALQTLSERLAGDDLAPLVAAALEDSQRANVIVDEVLAVGLPGSLKRAEVDLGNLVAQAIDRYRARAAARAVEIAEELAPDLRAMIDRSRIDRALGNLFDNALQVMPHSGTLRVTLAPETRAVAGAHIAVTDTGTGVPADIAPSIFEPFVTGRDGGSGLGLAITRRIVLDHGGQIHFETEPGRGTTFHIWLPCNP